MIKKVLLMLAVGSLVLAGCNNSGNTNEQKQIETQTSNIEQNIKPVITKEDNKFVVNLEFSKAREKINKAKKIFTDKDFKTIEEFLPLMYHGSVGSKLQYVFKVSDKKDTTLFGVGLEVDCTSGKIYRAVVQCLGLETAAVKEVLKEVDFYKELGIPINSIDKSDKEGEYKVDIQEEFINVETKNYDKISVTLDSYKDLFMSAKDLKVLKSDQAVMEFTKKVVKPEDLEKFKDKGGTFILDVGENGSLENAKLEKLAFDNLFYMPFYDINLLVADEGLSFSDSLYNKENEKTRKKEILEEIFGKDFKSEEKEDYLLINDKYSVYYGNGMYLISDVKETE